MRALIDGDIVVYRCAWASEGQEAGIAKFRTDEMMQNILNETKADDSETFLTDSAENNFRYKIYPQYKANRPPKPFHYNTLKEHLIVEWGARIAHNEEADDALGIRQDKTGKSTVICSIDKDLLTIPGNNYNFVKKVWTVVSPVGALSNFYAQFMIGDKADNIDGCPSIGEAKAAKILAPCETEEEMFEAVVRAYLRCLPQIEPNELLTHILQIGRVLKIRQTEDEELWIFPKSKLMVEIGQLFIQQPEEEDGLSTEPTSMETNGMLFSGE